MPLSGVSCAKVPVRDMSARGNIRDAVRREWISLGPHRIRRGDDENWPVFSRDGWAEGPERPGPTPCAAVLHCNAQSKSQESTGDVIRTMV